MSLIFEPELECQPRRDRERMQAERLRLRVDVELGEPGALARQEVGKARRVFTWEQDAPDPCPLG